MARVIQYNMLSEDNNIDMTRKPPPVPLQQPFGPGFAPKLDLISCSGGTEPQVRSTFNAFNTLGEPGPQALGPKSKPDPCLQLIMRVPLGTHPSSHASPMRIAQLVSWLTKHVNTHRPAQPLSQPLAGQVQFAIPSSDHSSPPSLSRHHSPELGPPRARALH